MVFFFEGMRLKLAQKARAPWQRWRDAKHPTFGSRCLRICLHPLLDPSFLREISSTKDLKSFVDRYLEHHFDLLGSGWREMPSPASPLGTRVNAANRVEAERISALIDSGYKRIDWQLDFKSNHRWDEATWHKEIRYGHVPGADVKVPWELARLQHLPQMALSFLQTREVLLAREFRNQTLDFISSNPPRFGVNWRCAMDVSIRAVNILVAHELFCAGGAAFDREFEEELARSLIQHGQHIRANLEWHRKLRTNHYLSNLAGLIFLGLAFESIPFCAEWVEFAIPEFLFELKCQFQDDGTNFEASVCYHRLSGEIAAFTAALLLGRGRAETRALGSLLVKMAEFTKAITKPNGKVAQIGDNDSGRFFKLHPISYPEEDFLDHRPFVAVVAALTGQDDLRKFAGSHWLDVAVARSLARGKTFEKSASTEAKQRLEAAFNLPQGRPVMTEFSLEKPLPLKSLELKAFPDFGLYLYRADDFFLAIRCGSIGQNGFGGHAHNDQLSLELYADGRDLIADPGTGVYTADLDTRDKYRSVRAHFAPQAGLHEPGDLSVDAFLIKKASPGRCLKFDRDGFIGAHSGYGAPVHRKVEVLEDLVRVTDVAEPGLELSKPVSPPSFSSGYGRGVKILHRDDEAQLLLVSQYGPEGLASSANRNRKLSLGLAKLGIKMGYIYKNENEPRSRDGSAASRIAILSSFAWKVSKWMRLHPKGVAVIAVPPAWLMVVAFVTTLFFKKRVILDYRDPVINPDATPRPWPVDALLRLMQAGALKRCGGVSVAAPGIAPLVGGAHSPVTVLSGFDPAETTLSGMEPSQKKDRTLRCVYGGTFYGTRSPLPLAKAYLSRLRSKPPEEFDLVFDFFASFNSPDEEKEFRDFIQKHSLTAVFRMHSLLSRERFLSELATADLLLIITHEKGSEYAIPGKIFDYIGMNKPLFVISSDQGLLSFLKETGVAAVLSAPEPGAITVALERLAVQGSPATLNHTPIEELSCYRQARHLASIVEKISKSI